MFTNNIGYSTVGVFGSAPLSGILGALFGRRSGGTESDSPAPSALSAEMYGAIGRWLAAYRRPNAEDGGVSLRLPAIISAEIARLVTVEAEFSLYGSDRAGIIQRGIERRLLRLREDVEYACAGGGGVFKPYVSGGEICVEFVPADRFIPLATDDAGEISDAVFVYRTYFDGKWYTRFERHTLDGGKYTVVNRTVLGDIDGSAFSLRGRELEAVPMTDIPCWSELSPCVEMSGIRRPLYAYFRIPLGNTVDPRSPLGVSVFSRAEGLIREADAQLGRLIWEFEGGELAVDASEDIFRRDRGGPVLPKGKERLFRINALDTALGGEGMKVFSPRLRDESLTNGLDLLLMRIEDACAIARGTVSSLRNIDRTATEIRESRQRSYSTVRDIQRALEAAIRRLVAAADELCDLYCLCDPGKVELTAVFGDSLVGDENEERVRDAAEVAAGLMHAWEFRAKWFGESADAAKRSAEMLRRGEI